MEWITEAAPKDGTVFLTYWEHHPVFAAWVNARPVPVTIQSGPFWRRKKVETVGEDETGYRVVMWFSRGDVWAVNAGYAPFSPTHWMPLPPPPKPLAPDTPQK